MQREKILIKPAPPSAAQFLKLGPSSVLDKKRPLNGNKVEQDNYRWTCGHKVKDQQDVSATCRSSI